MELIGHSNHDYSYFIDMVKERIFSISQDAFYNVVVLAGYEDIWLDMFIEHMGSKVDNYVTDVFKQVLEGKCFGSIGITNVMMNKVYERMK